MAPAFSIIFFTCASGAGYGLLIALACAAIVGAAPSQASFWLVCGLGAAILIAAGLVSSTFHLGHPERAWRAFTQWRTSWLSREAVLAALSAIPATVFVVSGMRDPGSEWTLASGAVTIVLSIATIFSTAMIYASLATIPAWRNGWVPLGYIVLGLLSGALLFHALLSGFGFSAVGAGVLGLGLIVTSMAVKVAYWRFIDRLGLPSTRSDALGLKGSVAVRPLDPPHTEANYVQKEMGFAIARRHARRLRRIVVIAGFGAPALLVTLSLFASDAVATVLAVLAVGMAMLAVLVERWLFFAEARHVVTLYH